MPAHVPPSSATTVVSGVVVAFNALRPVLLVRVERTSLGDIRRAHPVQFVQATMVRVMVSKRRHRRWDDSIPNAASNLFVEGRIVERFDVERQPHPSRIHGANVPAI